MSKRISPLPFVSPETFIPQTFETAVEAVDALTALYERNTAFLTDAFTAMGTSISLVWNNLPVMLAWGAIVLALFILSLATGLLGLIVVFPLLGHATWHSYRAIA